MNTIKDIYLQTFLSFFFTQFCKNPPYFLIFELRLIYKRCTK